MECVAGSNTCSPVSLSADATPHNPPPEMTEYPTKLATSVEGDSIVKRPKPTVHTTKPDQMLILYLPVFDTIIPAVNAKRAGGAIQ